MRVSNPDTMVTIVCYGKAEQMKKREAEKFYKEAFYGSEGYEKQRYGKIIADLHYGAKLCWDGEEHEIPKGYHMCPYCYMLAKGNGKDLLCGECRTIFGHSTINEL